MTTKEVLELRIWNSRKELVNDLGRGLIWCLDCQTVHPDGCRQLSVEERKAIAKPVLAFVAGGSGVRSDADWALCELELFSAFRAMGLFTPSYKP